MSRIGSDATWATLLGMLAVVLWGSTIAFGRTVAEQLGTVYGAACINMLAGTVGAAFVLAGRQRRKALCDVSARYAVGCGALFVGYIVCVYLAVGWASGRPQVLVVTVCNYLWPSLVLGLSVFVNGARARWTLLPGMLVAFTGVALALMQTGRRVSLGDLAANVQADLLPCVLAIAAAGMWALYSNLNRRWARESGGGTVPFFFLAAGVMLLFMSSGRPEAARWSGRVALEVFFLAMFPGLLAYGCWDVATRKGKIVLLGATSYVTPIFSVLISRLYLGVTVGRYLWAACVMVTAGAVLCKWSLREPESRRPPSPRSRSSARGGGTRRSNGYGGSSAAFRLLNVRH